MNYRIVEHPEGNFIPQLSEDSGVSWKSLICYLYDKHYKVSTVDGDVVMWGTNYKRALETIENHKNYLKRAAIPAISRVVYQE